MAEQDQHRRRARVASAVTEMEREALEAMAKVRGVSISQLLHEMSISDALTIYLETTDDAA